MICRCLLYVSQQGPCVTAAVLNPPFEMGTWLPFGLPTGCEQRYPTPRLAATLTLLERILKRFGAQTLCCCLSFFSIVCGSPDPPHPTPDHHLNTHTPTLKHLLPYSAEGSFRGFSGKRWSRSPGSTQGLCSPAVKSTVSLVHEQSVRAVASVKLGQKGSGES